jgi:hypothetical protein
MKSLSEELEKINNELLEENKRILQMLTSLKDRSGISSPKF